MKRLLLLAAVLLVPVAVHARDRGTDPLARLDQQKHRNEERRTKRRAELDLEGAEIRDAKQATEDSKQNAQMNEFGQPNTQQDRWGDFFPQH